MLVTRIFRPGEFSRLIPCYPEVVSTRTFRLKLAIMSDDKDFDQQHHDDLAVQEAQPKLKHPPLFRVLLLNDDYTPMEFVVHVLQKFFAIEHEKATQIMMHVHTRGMGICGVFPKDIAETKVVQVNEYSRNNQHPLLCDMEED